MMPIDPQKLDQLVDGELTDFARRELIASFDQHPEGWQQCACAFLEAQEFAATFSNEAASMMPLNVATTKELPESPSTHLPANELKSAGSTFAWGNAAYWLAALAACLLVGIVIGQGSNNGSGSVMPVVATDPGQTLPPQPVNQLVGTDSPTLANTQLADLVLEQPHSAIPDDIEDIFDRLGQRVERRHVFMPVRSQNGLAETLPVEEIELVPVRWETY